MTSLMICMLTLLIACFPEENRTLSPPDPTTFSRATDLMIDSSLDGVITMQVDVLHDEHRLTITVNNGSDFEINIGSQSEARIKHPSLQYFDGEDWRRVPRFPGSIVDEYDLEYRIAPGAKRQFSLNLNNYRIPESSNGLFRVVLTANGIDPARGYGTNAHFRHDIFADFSLE